MSRHELCYEILNAHNLGGDCTRTIDVHATPSNGSSSRNGSSTAERRPASVPGESFYAI